MNRLQLVMLILALVTGALNTMGFTLQNKQKVNQAGIHKHFFHPYMQVAMRFVSNSLAIVVYWINKQRQAKSSEQNMEESEIEILPQARQWMYIIPALLDYVSMVCYYTALNFIPGSVYQMLRGGTVITTFVFSALLLKSKTSRQKQIGCLMVLFGLLLVGLSSFIFGSGNSIEKEQTLIGYGLIVIALFCNGIHFVAEEYLLTRYNVRSLYLIGMQGVLGLLISIVVVPLLSLVPCNFGQSACVYNSDGNPVIQDYQAYFIQVSDNWIILLGVGILIASMATYNSLGAIITKQINSLARSLIDVTRTVIIWMVGVIFTATLGKQNSSFKWESLEPLQLGGQSLGFTILIIGNLIYYELIVIKCLRKRAIPNESLVEQSPSTLTDVTV